MASSKTGLLAAAFALLAAAGCQSERMSSLGQPAPLPAAPAGTVTASQLPPPAAPGTGTEFPAAPGQPQTKFGAGFRAGPLRCPAPIDGVKSWNVAGKQLTLHDANGSVLARLYSSGPEKFDGQTESGLPISLTR